MERMVVYHNPACSKCRGTLDILREQATAFDIVEYLQAPLTAAQLADVLRKLDGAPADLVRKDGHFKELGLNAADYTSAEAVVQLLVEHPRLMQRPVVVRGERAVIARPPENVAALL